MEISFQKLIVNFILLSQFSILLKNNTKRVSSAYYNVMTTRIDIFNSISKLH